MQLTFLGSEGPEKFHREGDCDLTHEERVGNCHVYKLYTGEDSAYHRGVACVDRCAEDTQGGWLPDHVARAGGQTREWQEGQFCEHGSPCTHGKEIRILSKTKQKPLKVTSKCHLAESTLRESRQWS